LIEHFHRGKDNTPRSNISQTGSPAARGYNTAVFTGLIRDLGVMRLRASGRIEIACPGLRPRLNLGDSVAVNGACLTVAQLTADGFGADLLEDTQRNTTLGALPNGRRVNLELPLAAGERFGGHFVQGHVDGMARLLEKRELGSGDWRCTFEMAEWLRPLAVDRGSIAIDGVSLTIQELAFDKFSMSLIPTTFRDTALGDIPPGGMVNVEADLLVKAVVHALRSLRGGSETGEFSIKLHDLRELGYGS
jgi:riboflavin synthase